MRKKESQSILHQTQRARGIGYLIDLLCATRIGRKAPRFYQNRGQKMAVFANDYIGILINQFGVYEKDELDLLFDFLTPIKAVLSNGLALDIGANIGNHSVYFSSVFAKVYAFEPNPDTYCLLKFNSKTLQNVKTFNIGLGEKTAEMLLKENNTNLGGSFIVFESEKDSGLQKVTVKTLDDLDENLSEMVFLKIDVEGFEEKVIKGGIKRITNYQPIIVLEQAESEFVGTTTPSIQALEEIGYVFCWQDKLENKYTGITRKILNIYRTVFDSNSKIVTGKIIPKRFHSMLIAVPPRFHSLLNRE